MQEEKARKAPGTASADGNGIATTTAAARDDSIRYHTDNAPLGRTHAARVGPGNSAGVATDEQAREIDRFHVEPKTKVGYATDNGDPSAGSPIQARYIDRYAQLRKKGE